MPEQVPAHFEGFFDDAAIFPPGSSPLDAAVAAHLVRRDVAYGRAVGPFLVGLGQLADAVDVARTSASGLGVDLTARPLQVGVVVPAGSLAAALETVDALGPEVEVVGVELRTDDASWPAERDLAVASAARRGTWVELTAAQVAAGAAADLAGTGLGLKFRTGGLEAALFPSVEEVASVLVAATAAGLRFKLTAGLHRAVRYLDPATGFTHHGFLNIAVATALALRGAEKAWVVDALASVDADALRTAFVAQGDAWRDTFVSFGTCSVTEPAETLVELDLLAPDLASGASPHFSAPADPH